MGREQVVNGGGCSARVAARGADLAGAASTVMNALARLSWPHPGAPDLSTPGLPERLLAKWSWERTLMVMAVVAAALAFWVTLHARFLQYPDWLAVQKADFILGPIAVGLYWHRRRPHNRLGLMLIGLGLLGTVYILQSSTIPALFGIGLLFEPAIFSWIIVVILAFPNGRLDEPVSKLIVGALLIGVVIPALVFNLTAPSLAPVLPISGCRTVCPQNALAVWPPPSWTPQLEDFNIVAGIATGLATAAVLVGRFVTGTPPRRRALAIGTPIAMLFLLASSIYLTKYLLTPGAESTGQQPIRTPLDWIYAASPSLFWYGFLFALIAAQLFAGRVLRDVVRRSHGRPSFRELQGMLRGPLGDPGLRVGFWDSGSSRWAGPDGGALKLPAAGQTLTEIERNDELAVALVHDAQLSEDPELLQAAGAVLALAAENAQLDASQKESLRERNRLVEELRASRARIVETAERERRRLERDLHDGAQQRLMGIQIKLKMAERHAPGGLAEELEEIKTDAVDAAEELRALAHGIYPGVLRARGLADALRSVAMSAPITVEIEDAGIGRASEAIEAAIYFCACEAIQNAAKHAGPGASVTGTLARRDGAVEFAVVDDGVGMTLHAPGDGLGLVGMVDRIEAVGGRLEIVSAPGQGTSVRGRVPDHHAIGGQRFARAPTSQATAPTRAHAPDGQQR